MGPEAKTRARQTAGNQHYAHVIEDRRSPWRQWPYVLIMVFIWCALWQDFHIVQILIGLVVSIFVMITFRLPNIPFADRFNLWYTIKFTVIFLWKIIAATTDVAWQAIRRGPRIVNSIIGVKLRSHDDLIVTLVGHAYALIPGSLVIDVDRRTSTLYLHVLNAPTEEAVEAFREDSLKIEAHIIRAIGSKQDYALVKAEDEAGDGVIRRHPEEFGKEETDR